MNYGKYYRSSPRHRIADEPIRQVVALQPGLLPVMHKIPEKTLLAGQSFDLRMAVGAGSWLVGISFATYSQGVEIQIQDRTTEQMLFDEPVVLAVDFLQVGSLFVTAREFLLPSPKLLAGSGVLNVSLRNRESSSRLVTGALEFLEP